MEVGEATVGGMSAFHSGMFGKEAQEDEKKKAAERERFLGAVKGQQQQQPPQHEQTISQRQFVNSSEGFKVEVTAVDTPPFAQTWHQPGQYTGCVR